jgi:hypothetical protein
LRLTIFAARQRIRARPLDAEQLGEMPVTRNEQQAVDALREWEVGERLVFGRELAEAIEARRRRVTRRFSSILPWSDEGLQCGPPQWVPPSTSPSIS